MRNEGQGILNDTNDVNEGYCLVLGAGTGRLAEELGRLSDMEIIVLDPDKSKVDALRRGWQQMNLTGEKISALTGEICSSNFPAYLANLIVSEDLTAAGIDDGNDFVKQAFYSLRPYGGKICLQTDFWAGDFDHNSVVNFDDLRCLSQLWLAEGTSMDEDQFPDRKINLKDYMIMARYWQKDYSLT